MPQVSAAITNERVAWVDYSKGICILLVVMMHATLGVEDAVGKTGFMHYMVEFARPFRMPDFFLLSGLFLARVIDRDWRLYLDRKVVHFFYFYILWLLIQGAFKWPGLALSEGPAAVAEQFLLALVEPFGTLWFIYLLPIFFVAAKLLKPAPRWLVLVAAAALEMAVIHTGWTVIDEFAERFVYFVIGWTFAPHIFAFARRVGREPLPALVGLPAWAAVNALCVALGIATLPGMAMLLGLLGSAAIVAIGTLLARARLGELIRFAGEHSITIYLAFFLPMAVSRLVLLKTGIVTDVGWISLIVWLSAALSPLVLYLAIRKTGWGTFLFERPKAFRIDRPRRKLAPAE
ncbi:acyltransferase family protein [Terrihabitans rhizophilus]|uniref:Acyltransferase family protein n=1 Tax=Terrihabitans rhizophilus TaxID=3092662 RepID=A0ABU4RLH4_9HYPH|nr:acyltransferase family protein [Terrihabitans sp. PJ23]MDX6805063.1 acyltransferase family protein [Terrihabitans sp. PJ23]